MVLSHMVIAWWDILPMWLIYPMYAAGGLTFPIMAYFVVEGYKHTSNLKKYILRLLTFGLIALPFHILTLGFPLANGDPSVYPWLNIMFTIILSLLVLIMYDKIKVRAIFWLIYVFLIVPIAFMFFEWGFFGTTTVLLFYIIRNENARRIVPPILAGIFNIVPVLLLMLTIDTMESAQGLAYDIDFIRLMPTFAIGCFLVALLLKNYNGERGKQMKWLFYAAYPPILLYFL